MRDGPLERNRPGGTIPAARPPGRRRLTRAPGRPADKERIPGGSNIEIKGSVALVAGPTAGSAARCSAAARPRSTSAGCAAAASLPQRVEEHVPGACDKRCNGEGLPGQLQRGQDGRRGIRNDRTGPVRRRPRTSSVEGGAGGSSRLVPCCRPVGCASRRIVGSGARELVAVPAVQGMVRRSRSAALPPRTCRMSSAGSPRSRSSPVRSASWE